MNLKERSKKINLLISAVFKALRDTPEVSIDTKNGV